MSPNAPIALGARRCEDCSRVARAAACAQEGQAHIVGGTKSLLASLCTMGSRAYSCECAAFDTGGVGHTHALHVIPFAMLHLSKEVVRKPHCH